MGRYYRGSRQKYHRSAGQEAALRHIREAQEFSREIGGNDADVKDYFFSLNGKDLDSILSEYGRKYGSQAEDYARDTLHKWRSGKTKMSGMVAKRLFDILPPRMPVQKKYELAENIWRHYGPSSQHSYTVGPNSNITELAGTIADKLEKVVLSYPMPENIRNRFNWLAAGDVQVKEQLLNHFRSLEKSLAIQKISLEIPILQRQIRDHISNTGLARSEIQIHKHSVTVSVDGKLDEEIIEGVIPNKEYGGIGCLVMIGIAILLAILARR